MEERHFSEQELVRREKLNFLREKGIDPFGQRFDVTAFSTEIKEKYAGKTFISDHYPIKGVLKF